MHLGIDLGGTKTEIVALAADKSILWRHRVASPQHDYPATLRTIQSLVETAEQQFGAASSLGIGIPGALSPHTRRVKNANSTWLIGQPLQTDLEQSLQRPVALANDADCFTLSEAMNGAARGYRSVFGVILGTGVGGGFYLNDRLVQGPNAISGEWGHNPLPWRREDESARPCYCGKAGCIETFLSGPGFAAQHHLLHPDQAMRSEEIVRLARQAQSAAKVSLNRYIDQLARALASVINTIDPEIIVLGGGMSNIQELYAGVSERLPRYVFGGECSTPICEALHGDSSGVLGAAWLGIWGQSKNS